MSATMPALTLHGPGDVALIDKPVPEPGPGEVLLHVEANTICGTDLRLISGQKTSGVRYGATMGHEVAGRIAAIGEGVAELPAGADLTVGQQATVSIVVSCGTCRACLSGREHLCTSMELIGYAIDGGMAPYLLVPARAVARGNVIPVPEEIPANRLAIAEPMSCILNGHRRHGGVNPGETVLVIGGGPIGLLHTQLNLASGAAQVILSENNESRRDAAAALGAITTTPDRLEEVLAERTGGWGADVVVVAIGLPALAQTSLSLAAPGGRVSWFAGFPKDATAQVDPNTVHYGEIAVSGGSNARRADVHDAVRLLARGVIDEKPIVTHTFGLSEWEKAIDAVKNHVGVKIAIDPNR